MSVHDISYWQQQLKNSHQMHDRTAEINSLLNLATLYVAAKEPKTALKYLNEVALSANEDDATFSSKLHETYALCYKSLQSTSTAINSYQRAVKEYKQFELPGGELRAAMVAMEAGRLAAVKKLHSVAATLYGEAAEAYAKAADGEGKLRAMSARARQTALIHNSSKDAIALADECQRMCHDTVRYGQSLGAVYNELGLTYMDCKAYESALKCFLSALPYYKAFNWTMEATLCQNLGCVYNAQLDFENACKFHEMAAHLYTQHGNMARAGQSFMDIAYCRTRMNKLDLARSAYELAHEAAVNSGNHTNEWQALEGLAASCLAQGQLDGAIAYYKKAFILSSLAESGNNAVQDSLFEKLTVSMKKKFDCSSQERMKNYQAAEAVPGKYVITRSREQLNDLKAEDTTEEGQSANSKESTSSEGVPLVTPCSGQELSPLDVPPLDLTIVADLASSESSPDITDLASSESSSDLTDSDRRDDTVSGFDLPDSWSMKPAMSLLDQDGASSVNVADTSYSASRTAIRPALLLSTDTNADTDSLDIAKMAIRLAAVVAEHDAYSSYERKPVSRLNDAEGNDEDRKSNSRWEHVESSDDSPSHSSSSSSATLLKQETNLDDTHVDPVGAGLNYFRSPSHTKRLDATRQSLGAADLLPLAPGWSGDIDEDMPSTLAAANARHWRNEEYLRQKDNANGGNANTAELLQDISTSDTGARQVILPGSTKKSKACLIL